MATWTFRIENGDFVPSAGGGLGAGLDVVEGSEKLAQDVRGILLTERSGIPQAIGVVADPFTVRAVVSSRITSALQRLREAQQRRQRRDRTSSERLLSVTRVDVAPSQDPRVFLVKVQTLSEAGADIPVGYALPRSQA